MELIGENMALPIAMAGVSAGLSILGGIAGNAAIADAATKQYEANKLFIERDSAVAQEGLQYAAQGINNEVGAMLSNLVAQGRQANAQMAAQRAETNVYGNTAARQQAVLAIKEELTEDNMIQQAESKMTAMQTKMRETKYQTEAKHQQNLQSYNNMMSQQQSTLEIASGAFSAGMQGYSLGSQINAANAAEAAAKKGE